MQKSFQIKSLKGTQIYPLGVSFEEEGLRICAVCSGDGEDGVKEAGIVLYDRKHREGVRIPFPEDCRVGAVCAMLLCGYRDKTCRYLFYRGKDLYQDPYCKRVEHTGKYGEPKAALPRCLAEDGQYDWGEDGYVHIPPEEMILYALHVRGFTKHRSSGVKNKGTYAGVTEKIPYLQELGVNTALLMPCYEFDEVMPENTAQTMEQAVLSYKQELPVRDEKENKAPRVNYWGYQKGLYYVPKGAYASEKDAVQEYKDMVRAFHGAGIGVAMQFYFPPEVGALEILDILKYWVLEYHIDGFHLLSASLPIDVIAAEPLLAGTMLLTAEKDVPWGDKKPRNLMWLSDSFLYDMRRFLKGDDNMVNQFISYLRDGRSEGGCVNSVARWDGFRLLDLVSYDGKHNEANGEGNQDGMDYNCSWNCGVEGKSRKKGIQELRLRQMKNALTLLFMSGGVPLLYSGDEFANTQEGNNNPYCQDNELAWIKWNRTEMGKELLAYTKLLIHMRKKRSILQNRTRLRGADTLISGFPDISFHGREAWRPDTGQASRCIAILYCGYREETGTEEQFFYVAVNMHWGVSYLGLPKLPKGKRWGIFTSTGKELPEIEEDGSMQELCVPSRTIVLCTARDVPTEAEKPSRRKNGGAKKSKETIKGMKKADE